MRKPSPATVLAFAALLISLSGTALAARQYVITNVHQIKPSVLTQLEAGGPFSFAPSQQVRMEPGHFGSAAATCRPGFHLVTGGYSGEVGAGARIVSDGPTSNGWEVLIDGIHAQAASTVLVRALCTPGQLKKYPLPE